MTFIPIQKLKQNIEATRIALEYSENPRKLSEEEIQTLRSYNGYGGIKAVLYGDEDLESWYSQNASKADIELYTAFQELYNLLADYLTPDEYKSTLSSMKNSILSAFYTPSIVCSTFYNVLSRYKEVQSIYDPSTGSGVFIIEADKAFKNLQVITAYEKDILTSKITNVTLQEMLTLTRRIQSWNNGFENSYSSEDGQYDLITSNIPYGNIPVYDPKFPKELTSRIHNYFFAKGLDKLKEGGILAFLTTNAFLDTPGNKEAREYLFQHSDFISLTVMPDNLMKDTANTEAPSHFLVVQKRSNKAPEEVSEDEQLLIETRDLISGDDTFSMNCYIIQYPEIIIGETSSGKNQYGKTAREVWWNGSIEDIGEYFGAILRSDFYERLKEDQAIINNERVQEVENSEFSIMLKEIADKINIENILSAALEEPKLKVPTEREKNILKAYKKIKNWYFLVEESEQKGKDCTKARTILKAAYDEFYELYGRLNKSRNRNLLLTDKKGFIVLASVEVKIGQEYYESTALTKSNKGEVEVLKTDDVTEALAFCLGIYGKVDIEVIADITDKDEEIVVQELDDRIYWNPETEQFDTSDRYLAGNVYQKLQNATRILNELKEK